MDFFSSAPLLLLAASLLVVVPLIAVVLGLLPGCRLDLSRSVLVHAPAEVVWDQVRGLPALLSRHGKARDFGLIADWTARHGNGESPGSVWRAHGTWRGSPYWVDVEIARVDPGKEVAIRLRRDSLRTERGLREHLGALTLQPLGPEATKVTWRLRARLRGPRIVLARLASSGSLQARLLDLGLRSLKIEIDRLARDREAPAGHPAGAAREIVVPPRPPADSAPETTA